MKSKVNIDRCCCSNLNDAFSNIIFIIGLELSTPVLEHPPPFSQGKQKNPYLLHMSMSWLLAGALPAVYSRPQKAHSPSNSAVGKFKSAIVL